MVLDNKFWALTITWKDRYLSISRLGTDVLKYIF